MVRKRIPIGEKVIHRDKAGNVLTHDIMGKFGVRNRDGELVDRTEARKFLNRPKVKTKVRKFLGARPKYVQKGRRL